MMIVLFLAGKCSRLNNTFATLGNSALCINVKQKCFQFKRKHMESQKQEKKVKRARDTLTRTQSRTIFMFNLFVKWKYTSANNIQQSHIHIESAQSEHRTAHRESNDRAKQNILPNAGWNQEGASVLKDDGLFSYISERNSNEIIYIFLCQFRERNSAHSIEIAFFLLLLRNFIK